MSDRRRSQSAQYIYPHWFGLEPEGVVETACPPNGAPSVWAWEPEKSVLVVKEANSALWDLPILAPAAEVGERFPLFGWR